MDYFASTFERAAFAVTAAASACHVWEDGGDSSPVADTAWEADGATAEALDAVAGMDPALTGDTYPVTRVGRLVMAARLLVLAGTDEEGTSRELEIAAELLRLA